MTVETKTKAFTFDSHSKMTLRTLNMSSSLLMEASNSVHAPLAAWPAVVRTWPGRVAGKFSRSSTTGNAGVTRKERLPTTNTDLRRKTNASRNSRHPPLPVTKAKTWNVLASRKRTTYTFWKIVGTNSLLFSCGQLMPMNKTNVWHTPFLFQIKTSHKRSFEYIRETFSIF